MKNKLGVYIHVPFCAKKCPYCDFYSVSFSSDTAKAYAQAVVRNIIDGEYSEQLRSGYLCDSIYFGGGTPSILSAELISAMISAVRNTLEVTSDCEITLECNPCCFRGSKREKLGELLRVGVTRLSFGVQSTDGGELSRLGRIHSAEEAKSVIFSAAELGCENISADLMLALPEQSITLLDRTLDDFSALPLTHISAYMLKVEDGTPFFESGVASELPSDEAAASLYLHAVERLAEEGFEQYEISNFARDGFESRHNCKYWLSEEYYGIGPSASSWLGGKRFAVEKNLTEFIARKRQPITVTDSSAGSDFERFMLEIRLTKAGVRPDKFGFFSALTAERIARLEGNGLVSFSDGILRLTPQGCLVSNAVINYLTD